MEKTIDEMDLDEWEVLPDDGFLDIHSHEDVGRGLMVSKKLDFNPKGVFDMEYFGYSRRRIFDLSNNSCGSYDMKQIVPMPIHLDEEIVKEVIKVPIVETSKGEDQQDLVLQQVSFKKQKGNEFVDIKMDSPKSGSREFKSVEAGSVQFVEKKEDREEKKLDANIEEEIKWKENGHGGFNIWSWRLTGIGALCSIGMAAATICIFIIGSQQKQKLHQQNQQLQFQIYTDDKRFKHVVHQATKLNQTVSAVRGGPFNKAHITFGGCYVYDGL